MRANESCFLQGKKVENGGYRIRGRVCMELLLICPCFETVVGAHRSQIEVVLVRVWSNVKFINIREWFNPIENFFLWFSSSNLLQD